ncbi:hypothetical protein CROQUDRAFT_663825, partial [Cronartium quercuum f. sp. fusiforme G11]
MGNVYISPSVIKGRPTYDSHQMFEQRMVSLMVITSLIAQDFFFTVFFFIATPTVTHPVHC